MTRDACTWSARDDVFEGYVRGALSPEDRDAFEEHYFACGTCLAKLRAYEGLRAELGALPAEVPALQPVRGRPWRWALVPLAASLVLVAAVAVWLRNSAPVTPEPTAAVAPASQPLITAATPQTPPAAPPAAVPPQTAPVAAQPEQTAPAIKPPKPSESSPVVALSMLARVTPPPYAPATLRGPRDEAATKFDAAMRLYIKRDYRGALPGLEAAAALRPDIAPYGFFLGVCQLLTDQPAQAVPALNQAIAVGESPYLEEAHFYLAKARLRQGDITAAREELKRTIERQGRLAETARRLLAQVDALPAGRDRPDDP